MGTKCLVCQAPIGGKGQSAGFFALPFKEAKRKKWCDKLGLRSKFYYTKQEGKICFRHFPKHKIKNYSRTIIVQKFVL